MNLKAKMTPGQGSRLKAGAAPEPKRLSTLRALSESELRKVRGGLADDVPKIPPATHG
jgi:hypothetical protein